MFRKKVKKGYVVYENENGPVIGSTKDQILVKDGCVFKDLAGTGELLPYEDWRMGYKERAKDLASRLPVEMIAGLMLYSPHQMVPALPDSPFPAKYKGKDFPESGCRPWEMSDQQKEFLSNDHIRHVLVSTYQDTETAVRWQNSVQAYAESLPFGIPVNFSSDPRHGAADSEAEYKSGAGEVSKWPEGIGMAALFDPERVREFAKIVSREYRALGITTALGPQIDLATDPRWMRLQDTMGPDRERTIEMTKAYCDGLQTTENTKDGYQAQLDSIVLLKNKGGILPLAEKTRVYVPKRHIGERKGFFRGMLPGQEIQPVSKELLEKHFIWADNPREADAALVYIESPLTDGGFENGTYVPISLQYRPYTAEHARETSIAGSTWRENDRNRSYQGKTGHTANEADLDLVIDTKKAMGEKPVIVCLTMHNPTVCKEFEPYADAVLAEFGVSTKAVLDLAAGMSAPKGRLPVQLPKDMETVEKHQEDVAFDLEAYTDEEGNCYDYGFGLDFQGEKLS